MSIYKYKQKTQKICRPKHRENKVSHTPSNTAHRRITDFDNRFITRTKKSQSDDAPGVSVVF